MYGGVTLRLKTVLGGTTYQFKSVKEVMAKANEKKSGDEMAGLSAKSVSERIAAKEVLSELLVSDVRNNPAVPYEEDEVTRIIQDDCCDIMYGKIKNWSIAELREYLLSEKTTEEDIKNKNDVQLKKAIEVLSKMTNGQSLAVQ